MKTLFVFFLLSLSIGSFAQTKTLYLIRHAKSSHDDPKLTDIQRPLAERGHKDGEKVAKRIKSRGIKPDLILASPSIRTQQTSRYFCAALGYDYANVEWDSAIYRCSSTTLTQEIMKVDKDVNSLMVVGHNPATTRCANFFQSDTLFDNVPTTGVVAIEFDISSWAEISKKKGRLKFFEYPKRK